MDATLILAAILVAGQGAAGADPPDLAQEPVVTVVARWAVAIRVNREEEPPSVSRLPVKAGPRLPPDVVDYYRRPPGNATGMILDAQGNILTSFYNVSGTIKSIEIVLPSGRRIPARLIATDTSDDLALLRTDEAPADLEVPPLRWAPPERLRVGRMVIALGRSPDPARPTATFGIVSAVGRNGGRAFQTDAKLDYGNVGGPIADLDGAVVGLAGFVGHTYPMWGLNSGIGFGTTAETIRAVLPALMRGETIKPPERPFLGVGPSEVPAEGNRGARLGSVEPGSAAEQGGLKRDDVVLSFDGQPVDDFMELRRLINRRRPGEEVAVKVRRDSQELDLKVRIGKRAD